MTGSLSITTGKQEELFREKTILGRHFQRLLSCGMLRYSKSVLVKFSVMGLDQFVLL